MTTPPDYRRVKVAALRELAATGNRDAARELERRGENPALDDVTQLDSGALRQTVFAWREGLTTDERDRSLERAKRALFELECRYRVDRQLYDRDRHGDPPTPPPTPAWEAGPSPARCHSWRRPQTSTLYR